ncbi:MAG: HPr family phosphocarrier protein [Proteobacteria bacterium]|nr:HPr family phosphocarrier protein [Pseudomonadota bacterium]
MPGEQKKMIRSFVIRNTLGLHARAAAAFVKIANRFQSEILVRKEDSEVNGKSIMGVLMLAAAQGTEIAITARGDDSTEAMEALGKLIEEKFGED